MIFVNPKLLAKIEKKVDRLMAAWQIDPNDRHTIYQMVATIEAGVKTKVFYYKGGLVCDGWNGYRHYMGDLANPDPRSAFQGFYRMDRNKMVGWSIYMISKAKKKEDQTSRCNLCYGLYLVWEDYPKVWGFTSFQDFYTKDEQKEAAQKLQGLPHVKRLICEPVSDISGCYRLRCETTRKKSGLRNEWRGRVKI